MVSKKGDVERKEGRAARRKRNCKPEKEPASSIGPSERTGDMDVSLCRLPVIEMDRLYRKHCFPLSRCHSCGVEHA
jgi:hypothetical protein